MSRKIVTSCLLVLSWLAFAESASAQFVDFKVTVVRPAWFDAGATPNASADCGNVGPLIPADPAVDLLASDTCRRSITMSTGSRVWVPAALQRVSVWQAGMSSPCGTVLTDMAGVAEGRVVCDHPTNYIWLEVEAISSRGFRVGTFDEDGFWSATAMAIFFLNPALLLSMDLGGVLSTIATLGGSPIVQFALERTEVTRWLTRPMDFRQQTLHDFDVLRGNTPLRIGGLRGDNVHNHHWAAAMVEGLHFLYPLLFATDPASTAQSSRFLPSKWVVNSLFGAPTTFWDTVHVRQGDTSWADAMDALAHEVGHVIYNERHGDRAHFYWDAFANFEDNYMKEHSPCSTITPVHSPKFAAYEGFAIAVSDLVWAGHETRFFEAVGLNPFANRPGANFETPAQDCPSEVLADGQPFRFGFDIEGNVADFYAAMVGGVDPNHRVRIDDERHVLEFGDPVKPERSITLSLLDLYDSVAEAGPWTGSLDDAWAWALRDVCNGEPGLFCGTERFRCYVRNAIADEEPFVVANSAAFQDDCLADEAFITQIDTLGEVSVGTSTIYGRGDQRVRIWVTDSSYTDNYRVRISTIDKDPNARSLRMSNASNVETTLASCQTHFVWAETWVDGQTARTQGPSRAYRYCPTSQAQPLPGGSTPFQAIPRGWF